jgi:hypothetical protein
MILDDNPLDDLIGLPPELTEQHSGQYRPKPLKTPRELWMFMAHYLGIRIPYQRVCPNHQSPFEAVCASYFATDPVVVWYAARGLGGKSHGLAALALTEQITLATSAAILGGSGEQSRRVHEYLTGVHPNAKGKFWNCPNAPTHLIVGDLETRKSRTSNGGHLQAIMASQRSIRGLHPGRLRLDEVDELDIDLFEASTGLTMRGPDGFATNTTISSTWHHPDGTMAEVLRRAKKRGWPTYTWCWRENLSTYGGWLHPDDVERKKTEVSEAVWNLEFELQEPNPETRAIDPEHVDWMFNVLPGEFTGAPDPLNPVRLEEPDPSGVYAVGCDFAKSQDSTVICVIRKDVGPPHPVVCWQRLEKLPWSVIIGVYNQRLHEYPGTAFHDATGVGSVCEDFLTEPSSPFIFSRSAEKFDLLTRYVSAIEDMQIAYPMIDWAYSEHKFASFDQLYGKAHLPDSIVAGALAWKAVQEGVGDIMMAWR